MNRDQVKGGMKEVAGKIQQGIGKMTGSKEQEAKGIGKQVEGKTQEALGDTKEAAKDVKRNMDKH